MTRETPQDAKPITHPAYSIGVRMTSAEARPFVRTLYKLIKHYQAVADLRGSNNKSGYRLQWDQHPGFCDLIYAYDGKNGGFNIQTHFKPGVPNELVGRMLTLMGLILAYHKHTGKPLETIRERTTLADLRTLDTWGQWAIKELYKKFPAEFPELAGTKKVKF